MELADGFGRFGCVRIGVFIRVVLSAGREERADKRRRENDAKKFFHIDRLRSFVLLPLLYRPGLNHS
jgi:hypothetical protein